MFVVVDLADVAVTNHRLAVKLHVLAGEYLDDPVTPEFRGIAADDAVKMVIAPNVFNA